MKVTSEAGAVIFKLETGIEVELHGPREALSLTLGNKTFDIGARDGRIIVDGFLLTDLINNYVENFKRKDQLKSGEIRFLP
jgi:hypothetical protein